MKRIIRRRRAHGPGLPEISLTPLIDVALTLLIIFMVTSPMLNNAIKIELPQGKAQEAANTPPELMVFVDKQDHLYFNGAEISLEKLIPQLKKAVGGDKGRTVFVHADEHARYGTVIETVDKIKVIGGVQYVALATKKVC